MPNEFVIRNGAQISSGLSVTGSTSISGSSDVLNALATAGGTAPVFNVFGTAGQLFSVTDGLQGSLFSVNNISGLPFLEVFSDSRLVAGGYNKNTFIVSGSQVAIGKTIGSAIFDISGSTQITGSLRVTDNLSVGTTSSVAKFNVAGTTNVVSLYGSTTEGVVFDVNGPSGQLFSVVDGLSGSLFSVNTISGLPIMEAFSDATIRMGNYSLPALIITGSQAIITGSITSASFASTASFVNPLTQSVSIRGLGTTSATTALLVENSAANGRIIFRDDRVFLVQINDTGGPTHAFSANGSDPVYQFNSSTVQGTLKAINGSEVQFSDAIGTSMASTGIRINTRGNLNLEGNSLIRFYTSGSLAAMIERMRITNTGFVGIGTTSPSASLHISASSSTSSAALLVYKSGSTVLDIQGSQGQLFSVVDSLTGSLMSVNDVSGLPILEVFSDDRVVMGTYGNPALIISGSVANVTGSLVTQGQTIDPALIWFMS
jgi:hypothetical protein